MLMVRHEAISGRSAACRQGGSALLLVVGATAAVSALALATLSASLLAYEIATVEHQGALARLLARTGIDLVYGEIRANRLAPPAAGAQVTWAPALPPPPAGAPPLPAGCGFRVVLSRVAMATPPAGPPPAAPPPVLIDAVAEARCGRGFDRRSARFARADDGSVVRLY
jgi:hypothetical protein